MTIMGNAEVANNACFSFYSETVITYLIVNEKYSPWSPVLNFFRVIIIVY